MKTWTDRKDEVLVKLWEKNVPITKIAKRVNRNPQQVTYRAYTKLGLPPRRPRSTVLHKPLGIQARAYGQTKSLLQWSKDDRCEVCYNTLLQRYKNGMSLSRAMKKTPRGR